MTSLAHRPPAIDASPAPVSPVMGRVMWESVAVASLLLWWAVPMTRASGGRGPGATAIGLVLVAACLLLTAPWTRVGWGVLGLSLAVPAASLLVCLLSPAGWYGADDASSYTLAALAVPVFLSWARTPDRRQLLVGVVCVTGVLEFAWSFSAWWGGGDPSRPMVGTFYWWNPFAAYLLPGALLGVALAVRGAKPWRLLGWVGAPLCSAGIVFSSSRTTLALLVAGLLALLLLLADRTTRRAFAVRWMASVVLCVGVVFALTGPPFFHARASIVAGADARAAAGETATQNGEYRLQFWERALAVAKAHPEVGAGSHELVNASEPLVRPGLARSNLAHNGYLQALADGGLLLGLPFLGACCLIVIGGVRRLVSARSRADERWLRIALPIALGGLLAHSFVDFDWSHPSDLLLTGVLAALTLALPVAPRVRVRAQKLPRVLFAPVAIALACVASVAAWHWDGTQLDIGRTQGSPAQQAHALRQQGQQPLRDYRWAAAVLQLAALPHASVAHSDLQWALSATRRVAAVDAAVQVRRARAYQLLGDSAQSQAVVNAILARLGPERAGPVADQMSLLLVDLGFRARAHELVASFLAPAAQDEHAGEHLKTLLQIDEGSWDDIDRCAFASVRSAERLLGTPDPGAPRDVTTCPAVLMGVRS